MTTYTNQDTNDQDTQSTLLKIWFDRVLSELDNIDNRVDTLARIVSNERDFIFSELNKLRIEIKNDMASCKNSEEKCMTAIESRVIKCISDIEEKIGSFSEEDFKELEKAVTTMKECSLATIETDLKQTGQKTKIIWAVGIFLGVGTLGFLGWVLKTYGIAFVKIILSTP